MPHRTFAVSSTRDTSLQSEFGKMKLEADGSFKRAAASFRNCIQKDGEFAAERGSFPPNARGAATQFASPDRYRLYVSYACRTFLPSPLRTPLSNLLS